MKARPVIVALGLAAALAAPAGAAELRLRGDRLSLRADRESLRSVLEEFVRAGVRVRLDPALDRPVTQQIENADAERALRAMLAPQSYVLIWEVLEGPVGPLPQLAEIQVFSPGHPEQMVPVAARGARLQLTRKGPLRVDREILLALRPGTKPEDFMLLLDKLGATLLDSLPEWGIYRIRLPAGAETIAAAAALRKDPMVRAAEPNYAVLTPSPSRADAAGGRLAQAAGSTVFPPGAARVAVLDSGLALPGGWQIALAGQYDALNPGGILTDPAGHGTQMALLASGAVWPEGADAVAGSEVPVLAVRAFDETGASSNFDLLRAIEYAQEQGARVASLSWGTETASDFLASAIAQAQDGGMLIVAAAGNTASGATTYPAAYPGVLGVAATGADGTRWENSNYGNFVSLAAPGFATLPVGYEGPPGRYAGTSAATAYTAGVLARWFTAHPDGTAAQATAALTSSLTEAGAAGPDRYYGNGRLDSAAVRRLLAP